MQPLRSWRRIVGIALCLSASPCFAQETISESQGRRTNQPGDQAPSPAEDTSTDTGFHGLSLVPLPVIAANPSVGWMVGVAPSASWMMGTDTTTHRSSAVSTAIYTTKKQLLFVLKSNVFLKGDTWNLLGDWRYLDTSQPTFGLGTGSPSATLASNGLRYDDSNYTEGVNEAQMMAFKFVRFHETALKRLGSSRFFAGVGYHLDYHFKIVDELLDLSAIPPTITSHYGYSVTRDFNPREYLLSGASLNGLYDNRDNSINPYAGRLAFVSLRMNPTLLGSTKNSGSFWLEYRDYFNLQRKYPRHLIAIWTYGWFALGDDVPYLDLPALGWDQFGRSGRGYPQGRFRGQDLVYAEVEYRFPIPFPFLHDRAGGVLFANATTASNRDTNTQLFEYVDPAGGLGLRVMINKKARTNLTLDYGWGRYGSQGFYLNANEAF